MGFLEKKLEQGEQQAGELIQGYRVMLEDSPETQSIKQMVSSGAPAGSIGQRAADAHKILYRNLLANSSAKFVIRSKSRSHVVELFCIALWRKHLGDAPYHAMTKQLGLLQSK